MSATDFELAWRLWPEAWPDRPERWVTDRWKKQNKRERELAFRVLVEGDHMTNVSDTDTNRDWETGYVGQKRLSDICRQLREQFHIKVG